MLVGELEHYIRIIKPVLAFISIFYAAYMGGSLALLSRYLRTQVIHDEQWDKLLQYPITHHAYHVIRYIYTTSLVIGLCFIPVFAYTLFNFGLPEHARPSLFFPVLLGITSAACAYFVGVFNQVYLIIIALEIFKGMKNKDEQLTSEILHARHLEKKLKMRNLYMLLASRDFLIVPISYALDLSQILESLPFSITTVVTMLTSNSIFLAVPLAVITYQIRSSENRPTKNDLQKLMFAQAVIVLAILLVLFFLGLFSTLLLFFAIQSTGFIVPLNIMITTVVYCKTMAQPNCPVVVNLQRVEPLVVPIENVQNMQHANSSSV